MSASPWPTANVEGNPVDPPWELRAEGRAWRDDAWTRYMLVPHKIEMWDGKLLSNEQDRELLLGLLLENVGADRAVQFGDLEVWRAAVDTASASQRNVGR